MSRTAGSLHRARRPWFGLIAWPILGAVIGYHAVGIRGLSRASGAVSGACWGALAFVLYFFD